MRGTSPIRARLSLQRKEERSDRRARLPPSSYLALLRSLSLLFSISIYLSFFLQGADE